MNSAISPQARKVAVIGTSNIGAVKYAQDRIASKHPGLEVTCFGLPGGKFDDAGTVDGIFGPDSADASAVKVARRINGAPTIDLAPFDHILVIGDALGMPSTLWTALNYDIADWPTRTGKPLLSLPAFHATMAEAMTNRADHLRAQFGNLALHVALAPYPTTAVVPRGEHHQQPYAGMATHPYADQIHTAYRAALTETLSARAMTFIPQPAQTIASPFLTVESYGHGSMDFRAEGRLLNDHRHMNADFGTSLFAAFALAITPTPQT